jgi:glc operon protein GlcG
MNGRLIAMPALGVEGRSNALPPIDYEGKHHEPQEETMNVLRPSSPAVAALLVMLTLASASLAQSPAPPESFISVADAHAIIEGAVAYAREKNWRMGVVVLDASGEIVAGERMDGASGRNVRFAEGKAFAAVMYRTTTQALSELYKTRPDRYFGIMNMYGDKVYLVGGGEPLALDGKLIGAVGVAGLPEFEDERAGRAGIAAWEKARANPRK